MESKDCPALQCLADAGCDQETLRRYAQLDAQGAREQQICLLSRHRKALLGELHACQKKIDCLDYLLYRLREPEEGGRE